MRSTFWMTAAEADAEVRREEQEAARVNRAALGKLSRAYQYLRPDMFGDETLGIAPTPEAIAGSILASAMTAVVMVDAELCPDCGGTGRSGGYPGETCELCRGARIFRVESRTDRKDGTDHD